MELERKEMHGVLLPFAQGKEFYLRRGRYRVDRGDYWEALPLLRKAWSLSRRDAEAPLLLAEAYSEMGCGQMALDTLLNMVWRCDELPSQFDYLIGCEYLAVQDFDMALECFRRFHEKNPSTADLSYEMKEIGRILEDIDVSQWEGAFPDGDATENGAQILAQHGAKLIDRGEYESAVENLNMALEAYPDSDEFRVSLALALWMAGRCDEALDYCHQVLFHDPRNMQAHCLLALIGEQTGDQALRDREMEIIPALAKEAPDDVFRAAITAGELGEHTIAQELLLLCVEEHPYEPWIMHALGASSSMRGDFKTARLAWRRMSRLMPSDPVLHYYLRALKKEESRETESEKTGREDRFPYFFTLPEAEIRAQTKRLACLVNPFFIQKKTDEGEGALFPAEDLIRWGVANGKNTLQNKCIFLALRQGQHHRREIIHLLRQMLATASLGAAQQKGIADVLYCLAATEPYYAWGKQGRTEEAARLPDWVVQLDEGRQAPLRELEERMLDDEMSFRLAQWLWRDYLQRLNQQELPTEKAACFAAALSVMVGRCRGEKCTVPEEAAAFGIRVPELENTLTAMRDTFSASAQRKRRLRKVNRRHRKRAAIN